MNIEKAIEVVNRIRVDFFDNKYKDFHTANELEEKYEALGTILRYAKNNSITKEKVKDKIEIYKQLALGSFNRDSIQADEYRAIIKVLQELLEE